MLDTQASAEQWVLHCELYHWWLYQLWNQRRHQVRSPLLLPLLHLPPLIISSVARRSYALMHKYDYAGLYEVPSESFSPPFATAFQGPAIDRTVGCGLGTANPYNGELALDMFLTSFLVVFCTTVLITGGIQKEIKKGTIRPVGLPSTQR